MITTEKSSFNIEVLTQTFYILIRFLNFGKMSNYLSQYKVQRVDLTCDVIRKVAPFVLSKLRILVADWSMHWSRDTFLIKLRL